RGGSGRRRRGRRGGSRRGRGGGRWGGSGRSCGRRLARLLELLSQRSDLLLERLELLLDLLGRRGPGRAGGGHGEEQHQERAGNARPRGSGHERLRVGGVGGVRRSREPAAWGRHGPGGLAGGGFTSWGSACPALG